MWKVAYAVVFVVACLCVYFYLLKKHDSERADDAIQKFVSAIASDRYSLERGYSNAKIKAAPIYSDDLRRRTLAEIGRVYEEKRKTFDEAEQLRREAIALMNRHHADVLTLRASRVQAEELARKIKISNDSAVVLETVAQMFSEQQEVLAAEEKRRANEEEARRLEAERKVQEEQRRVAEAAAEIMRQRVAVAQAAQDRDQPSAPPEPEDCCCKTKVDVGLFFTKWEIKYRRLLRHKCTKPGFWDSHREGWCVPDSFCY